MHALDPACQIREGDAVVKVEVCVPPDWYSVSACSESRRRAAGGGALRLGVVSATMVRRSENFRADAEDRRTILVASCGEVSRHLRLSQRTA